jgi:hypothetical protein
MSPPVNEGPAEVLTPDNAALVMIDHHVPQSLNHKC